LASSRTRLFPKLARSSLNAGSSLSEGLHDLARANPRGVTCEFNLCVPHEFPRCLARFVGSVFRERFRDWQRSSMSWRLAEQFDS
jgi:hypothetical protein